MPPLPDADGDEDDDGDDDETNLPPRINDTATPVTNDAADATSNADVVVEKVLLFDIVGGGIVVVGWSQSS